MISNPAAPADTRASRWHSDALRLLADNVPALIAYFEAEGMTCEFANHGYAATFGLTEDEIVGRHVSDIIGADAMREIGPYIAVVLADNRAACYERRLPAPEGMQAQADQWAEVHLLPHMDEGSGDLLGCFVMIVDITRHRVAERLANESQLRLTRFMQASQEGIVFHKDGIVTDVNPPMSRLVGYPREQIIGQNVLRFVAPGHVTAVAAGMSSGEDVVREIAIVDQRGDTIPVELIARTLVLHGEAHRMAIVRDLRDRHAAQARIYHLAHHDTLTGLPNRTSFMDHLELGMHMARQADEPLALLFIDLDDFKRVNDSLGHLAGDKLLQAVAQRLTDTLRSTDRVARFGGDEFMVLLPKAMVREDVEDVARKLLAAVAMPVQADDRLISVTPSIGIATFPGPASSAADLIKQADSAMYLAKSRGRANYQFYDPREQQSAYQALVIESELAEALDREQFVLHFQPKVDASGALRGAEALLRWNHPRRGLLAPDQFIHVAEQQRLMPRLGSWVLREASHHARLWQAQDLQTGRIGVNLSAGQFRSLRFIEDVERVLLEDRVDPALLEFELSERTLVDDLAEVREQLARLKALGLGVCVDNFGTGYFSLRHLKELPLDCVKIDKSFVADLPHDEDAAAIVRAIVEMAHALRREVLAEGVETDAARRFLSNLGCDRFQGTAICPPLPAEEFADWVRLRHA